MIVYNGSTAFGALKHINLVNFSEKTIFWKENLVENHFMAPQLIELGSIYLLYFRHINRNIPNRQEMVIDAIDKSAHAIINCSCLYSEFYPYINIEGIYNEDCLRVHLYYLDCCFYYKIDLHNLLDYVPGGYYIRCTII